MATTTNFGWETPDDTDLVKDGALAMRTLGNAIDTSLVDLKGGTTGQVLSKTSNTDMDFTWVTSDDANAIQNTIVDAKGDLITATGSDVPARLAVGNNGDTLLADSSTTTGLRWQGNYAAGKNKLINGDFQIWQRGTSFTPASTNTTTYAADRWQPYCNFSAGTFTCSQQSFTAGTAPVAGYESTFFLRLAMPASGTITEWDLWQKVEDVRTFAGQTVTLSFWAKASTTTNLKPMIAQNFGSGGSSTVFSTPTTISLTTSWTRYSYTVTLASISGKTIGTSSFLQAILYNDSSISTSVTIDVWGVQLEAGSVATPFSTATGTLQGELAACQRYYYRQSAAGNSNYMNMGTGFADGTTSARFVINCPVQMRVYPTTLDYSTLRVWLGGSSQAVTALSFDSNFYSPNTPIIAATVASGLTTSSYYQLGSNNSANGYLGLGAEL